MGGALGTLAVVSAGVLGFLIGYRRLGSDYLAWREKRRAERAAHAHPA